LTPSILDGEDIGNYENIVLVLGTLQVARLEKFVSLELSRITEISRFLSQTPYYALRQLLRGAW